MSHYYKVIKKRDIDNGILEVYEHDPEYVHLIRDIQGIPTHIRRIKIDPSGSVMIDGKHYSMRGFVVNG